jgi:protein disulfide-isomerase A6
MYGIIKVGSINCLIEEELCEEFGAYEIPQLIIFSESMREDGERYRGKEDLNSMANAAARKMQNFVSIVTESNYPTFCEREKTKHHVILFTDKKSTPAILKSLSKKYIDRLLIGEVRTSESNLIQKFGI